MDVELGQYRAKENITDRGEILFVAGKVYRLYRLSGELIMKYNLEYTKYFFDASKDAHLVGDDFLEEKFVKTEEI